MPRFNPYEAMADRLFVGNRITGKKLDGDSAAKLFMFRRIHLTHSALAKFRADFVAARVLCRFQSSFLQLSGPVEDHRRWWRFRFADERADEKPLTVRRNVVFAKNGALQRQCSSFEKRLRRGELKFCPAGLHLHT